MPVRFLKFTLVLCVAGALLAACSTTEIVATPEIGTPPLCAPGVALGKVSVTLSTAWRTDQKEPEERERLARGAILVAFGDLRCGRLIGFDVPGADTTIRIVVRELGPLLTISIPVLWSLRADVDYSVTVSDARSGAVRLSLSERRQSGGAFAVQGMGAVSRTFEDALRDLLYAVRTAT